MRATGLRRAVRAADPPMSRVRIADIAAAAADGPAAVVLVSDVRAPPAGGGAFMVVTPTRTVGTVGGARRSAARWRPRAASSPKG